ncbi:uncharacterized protein FIBRA_03150 [Fibroporia radiculosa]|uniref:Ricin B lectin domain-containing protein n=1 Tax=Fibroporia radiculosa TaxID=599839 RepID=J4HVU1_9APHY|nr:uncharacterized protein FIBRA_03150 [Fibroporia radiculosa]CCM01102.1 predicted protein [Fibroporia radiculosa]
MSLLADRVAWHLIPSNYVGLSPPGSLSMPGSISRLTATLTPNADPEKYSTSLMLSGSSVTPVDVARTIVSLSYLILDHGDRVTPPIVLKVRFVLMVRFDWTFAPPSYTGALRLNVRSKNQLHLPDPNDGSPLQSTSDDRTGTMAIKWNIVQLGNGKYSIQNQSYASYANCGRRAALDAEVVGRNQQQQFMIQETRIRGRYTISPTDSQLLWGLPDDELDTPVTLAQSYTDTRNQWEFIRI